MKLTFTDYGAILSDSDQIVRYRISRPGPLVPTWTLYKVFSAYGSEYIGSYQTLEEAVETSKGGAVNERA